MSPESERKHCHSKFIMVDHGLPNPTMVLANFITVYHGQASIANLTMVVT